jgi:hypothetical protein
MSLTVYKFSQVVAGLFELPTETARRLLPGHLEPIEVHHGTAVLSVMAFDFSESMVGAYGELVLSIGVAPLFRPGIAMPQGAFFPFQVGTTTRAAREHAIERWHLPHWMEDIEVTFVQTGGQRTARVSAGGAPILDLDVHDHQFADVSHIYQMLSCDGDGGNFLGQITMAGPYSDHEESRGSLRLFEHGFFKGLNSADVYDVPFREESMLAGVQTFEPLVRL